MAQQPRVSWQDGFNLAGIIFGWAISQSEDIVFLIIFTSIAIGFAMLGVWSHQEYSRAYRLVACGVSLGLISYVTLHQVAILREKELSSSAGALYPRQEPNPLSKCPVPVGAFAIYAGDSAAWTQSFPHTVLRLGNSDIIRLDRDYSGGLLVTASIFDDRGNLIARVDKNRYISTSYASYFSRHDRSSLEVFDHSGEKALSVTYINPEAVKISGVFRSSDGLHSLNVTDHGMEDKKRNTMNALCAGGNDTDWIF